MAKGYMPLFFDTIDETESLSDEEFGRLIRAAVNYAMGNPDYVDIISGNEKYAFPFLKGQIDRNTEISNTRAKARANKKEENRTNDNKSEQTITNDNKSNETISNSVKEKKKEKEKEKEKKKEEDKEKEFITDDEAQQFQSEQNRVLDAAEDAGFQKSNSVRARLISLYADHGLEKMLYGIDACVKHNAPTLAYLEAVLKGEPKKQKAKVNAQEYKQRDYDTVTDEIMQEQIRDMEEFMKREGKM